jgi:Asp-tRNA(Asn)/Glu-tRNA(Gln) amidotransferase A subunit family amidase
MMDQPPARDNVYDLKSIKLPYLSGAVLKLFVKLLEGPLRGLLIPSLFQSSGITWMRKQKFNEAPTSMPFTFTGSLAVKDQAVPEREWPSKPAPDALGFHFASVQDYARAYREGSLTPLDVANRALDAIAASNASQPPLRAIIAVDREDVLEQARQATERIKARKPLSLFDGVPVAIKDEVDMRPYPTTVGTRFLGKVPCSEDATAVARLRAAGALLIGKANMHEIGIGVTGLNPNTGTTRNPYNPDHFSGGSSSGPGTAVAAGLCPVALGADGGGSIRVPASFCGTVGLKPTFGRISEHGAFPLCWSVAHLGPLTASASDAALAYAVMAGPDLKDPNSLHQPAPTLKDWDKLNMKDLRLGIFWPWFRHASDEVVSACEAMLHEFEKMGASLHEVSIPGMEAARVAHSVTILSEMYQSMSATYTEHHQEHGLDVRTNLALAGALSASDYVQAQRVRTRLIAGFNAAMQEVDMILTPSTGVVAPPIPKDALPDGNSDLSTVIEVMRFATPANLTGQPAISFPVGYNPQGLPIGMQAIGHAWQEASLLGLALVAEQVVERQKPRLFYDLMQA